MRLQKQRLRLIVRDTANAQVSFQFFYIPFKFRTERRILYIVDCPIETIFSVDRHSSSPCSEMRMIVHSVEKLKHTILLRCNAKKTAHFDVLLKMYVEYSRQDSLLPSCRITVRLYSPSTE